MNSKKTTKHIGIVACSYEGAALCYQTICNEGAKYLGEHAHPEVSLHNYPLSDYMAFINKDDWNGVAGLMISSSHKLSSIGAAFIICPDNTIHQVFSLVKDKTPVSWLHIAEEVSKEAKKNNYKKLGILGTKYLMEGPVYSEILAKSGIAYETPSAQQRVKINAIIFDELVYGTIQPASKEYLLSVIDDLKIAGCDAIVLGCTEIPLIISSGDSSLPTLDSTRILAKAALKFAMDQKNFQ
jgi:aspartate racemase